MQNMCVIAVSRKWLYISKNSATYTYCSDATTLKKRGKRCLNMSTSLSLSHDQFVWYGQIAILYSFTHHSATGSQFFSTLRSVRKGMLIEALLIHSFDGSPKQTLSLWSWLYAPSLDGSRAFSRKHKRSCDAADCCSCWSIASLGAWRAFSNPNSQATICYSWLLSLKTNLVAVRCDKPEPNFQSEVVHTLGVAHGTGKVQWTHLQLERPDTSQTPKCAYCRGGIQTTPST